MERRHEKLFINYAKENGFIPLLLFEMFNLTRKRETLSEIKTNPIENSKPK